MYYRLKRRYRIDIPHPFDRYSAYTNLDALKEFSNKPLRKSIRVNTLKSSVEDFKKWAAEKKWQLEPIPWCAEGFYVDREDRTDALGKDLLHILGHTYMQEAASMLPVELLEPKPHEVILDMSAAPGSKTTQIAAKMNGRGVVVANDMQDKRIWTLITALQRCGVTNVVATKKVGQWFARHMTERFDRVLIDAPCTAQGTLRKDPTALTYSSEQAIGKAAKLQRELLESAVHAVKVGGRIVYSTCTLTPEENEEVVASLLNKFSDQVIPLELGLIGINSSLTIAQKDARKVDDAASSSVRLWPQTYNTEGFFCAVLEKVAPTMHPENMEWIHLKEVPLNGARQEKVSTELVKEFGTSFLKKNELLLEINEQLYFAPDEVARFRLPVVDFAAGLPFGKRYHEKEISLDHDLLTLRGAEATHSVMKIGDEELKQFLKGKDLPCDPSMKGQILVHYKNLCVGKGKAANGMLKNNLPRWMVQLSQ